MCPSTEGTQARDIGLSRARPTGWPPGMASEDSADRYVAPPGTDPMRHRPKLSFELVGCAWNGHVLVGTDAATTAGGDALVVRDLDGGRRWHRCLRCDAWMMLPTPSEPTREQPATRDEIVLPTRGRPLKSRYVLRLIAVVLYLLISKRLFGVRGGATTVAAERDHDISWAALRRHQPDGPAAAPAQA